MPTLTAPALNTLDPTPSPDSSRVHITSPSLKMAAPAVSWYPALIESLAAVLDQGVRSRVFRAGVDPVQLYISIAGISYFFFSNNHTLSAILYLEPLDGLLRAGVDRGVKQGVAHHGRQLVGADTAGQAEELLRRRRDEALSLEPDGPR